MPERRVWKRAAARLKVWCEGDDFTLLAETVNVSKAGLFVRTSGAPLPTGRFRLTIEEMDAVADVEVRWSRGTREPGRGGLGLEILGFERGAKAFEDFVERSTSRSGEYRISWPPGDEAAEPGQDD
jgi:hypothetical protein